MAILIFFILIFFVGFPLGEVSRFGISLSIAVSVLDGIVLVGSCIWFVIAIKKKLLHTYQFALFGATVGIFCVSLLLNIKSLTGIQLFTSSLYIVRFFAYGLLFFVTLYSPDWVKKLLPKLLFISGTFAVVTGYVQYFLYPSLRNLIYFGWDEHFYRMFGTFFDPNFFGLFLTLFFLYVLSYLFVISPEKKKISFAGLFCLASLTFGAIFLTYSRTALVALVAGLIVLFWHKHMGKYLLTFFIAGAMIITIFSIFFTKQTDVNSFFRITSASARVGSMKNAWTIFLDSPLYGIGFNAYRYAQYRHHFMIGSAIQEDHGASGADSSVLLVLATSGILGLSMFLWYLWSHVVRLVQSKKRVGLATFVAFFAGSFFVNGLFYPLLLVWVWVVLGLSEKD